MSLALAGAGRDEAAPPPTGDAEASRIFVFGNEFLEEDSFAHDVAVHLSGVRIVPCRSPDDLLDAEGKITILDVVKGIHEPLLVTDIAQLKTRNIMSLHDFDVGFFLTLMREMGEEKEVAIIGIPQVGNAPTMAEKVRSWI